MCALRERTVGQVARGVFHQPARRPVANGNTKQKNRGVYAPPNIYLLPRPKNGVASNRRLAEAASLPLWIFQSRRASPTLTGDSKKGLTAHPPVAECRQRDTPIGTLPHARVPSAFFLARRRRAELPGRIGREQMRFPGWSDEGPAISVGAAANSGSEWKKPGHAATGRL